MIIRDCVLVISLLSMAGMNVACQNNQYEDSLPQGMVFVPAGWFWMGESGGPPASQPRHLVYLDRFAIDRTEVTNQSFISFLQASGDLTTIQILGSFLEQGNKPVVGVTWVKAQAYCRWAAKRLPSEAEWEKAARGSDGRRYPWGNAWASGSANTAESKSGRVLPVGSYPSGVSPYGALEMCGNAAEWVADYFSPTFYSWMPVINPQGPAQILDHGLRGGSWDSPPEQSTTFFRDSSHSVLPNPRAGFRCAMSLDE